MTSKKIIWDKMELVDINSITPHPKNPHRITDKDIDTVKASIKKFGFIQPIVVGKDNVIRVGHTRWQAAKQLDYKQVPVIVLDVPNLDALLAIDNLTHNTAWEMDLLADLITTETDIDWTDFISERELAALLDRDSADEDEPPVGGVDVPPTFQILVNCDTELDQSFLFGELKRQGYDVHIPGDK